MQYEAIDKLRLHGYGYKKIASVLGLAENMVKSYFRRNPIDKSRKVCVTCGKPIKTTPHKREKKFCSDKCRMKFWNSHPELLNKKSLYSYTCLHCGKEFYSPKKNRKYCSRSCFANARRKEDSDGKI